MTIQNLYFGKDDAETDFTGSGLLQGSFLRTSIYEQVKSRSKSLVIGRKGSGKSALCLMLKKELSKENKTYACVVTPDAISADEIRRFQITGISEQQSKKLIWRYIFLVQICKFLLEVARSKHGNDPDWSIESDKSMSSDWTASENCSLELRKIREFLVANREVDDLNFQENFWRIINRIQTALSFKAFGQSVELKTAQAPNEGLDFSSKLEFLEGYLKKPLEYLNDYQLFLLVDKVDEIWDGNPSSNEMATGLLMASKEINQVCSNVSCTIFLRTDIYEQLQFFDKDKLRGDEVPVLWTSETLPEIILERARVSTKQQEMSQIDLWSNYFPSEVEGIKTSEFMVLHTLMRPRDLIQLCNLCVDIARRESLNPVQVKHIQQALNMYSSWKLNDLLGEYRVNYPFLNDLLLLFSNTSYAILRLRFEDTYNRLKVSFEERYPAYSNLLGIDSVFNILYGIGFIGVERIGKLVFYYQDLKTIEDSDRVFVVHPAFRNALRCTSSIDIQPYSPTNGSRTDRSYLFEEFRRGRSSIRSELEFVKSPTRGFGRSSYRRFLEQLDFFRRRVIRDQQLPAEVVGEISRNIGLMINEIEEATSSLYDEIQAEMSMTNAIRYLRQLKEKLKETGFASEKSPISRELEDLLEDY
jgi:GTPase SAR1 family protein